METKKNPEQDIYQYSKLFFNFSLFASILMILMAFEHQTSYQYELKDFNGINHSFIEAHMVPVELPLPPPKTVEPVLVKEVSNDIKVDDLVPIIDMVDIPVPRNFSIPDAPPIIENPDEIIDFAEVSPSPIGGMEAWSKYLQKNLKYPNQAKKAGIEGTVYVTFVINKDGSIQDVSILRGIGGGCDEETLRVLQQAPNWAPGTQGGIPVRVRMRLPVKFKLQ